MKVYTIFLQGERGWTDNKADSMVYELENEIDCNPETCGYKREEIKPFIESLESLETDKTATLGIFEIQCSEMDEGSFNNLPEFEGW